MFGRKLDRSRPSPSVTQKRNLNVTKNSTTPLSFKKNTSRDDNRIKWLTRGRRDLSVLPSRSGVAVFGRKLDRPRLFGLAVPKVSEKQKPA